nr:hypothetical protein [Lachnospiraceae bacterium]
MENVKEPLLAMFTDDPVNWVKWAVVFTVLIGFFILSVKIYGKIEYHLSIQKKADQARAKGHVIENAKRIKVRKKGTYQERKEGNKQTYSATYRYTIDGEEKEYHAYFGNNYPPDTIDLYYKNSPRKLFSVEEYYWQPFIGVLYLMLIFAPFVLAALTGMALDVPSFSLEEDKGSAAVTETGAWNVGTLYDGDYCITFSCPEDGHPDAESEWRTCYKDPREELDLDIKINYADAIPPQGDCWQAEAELWGHDIIYQEHMTQNRVWPDRDQSLFVGYLEMGPDQYLQIEIIGVTEVNTRPYMFLENEDFQNSFRLEIKKIL